MIPEFPPGPSRRRFLAAAEPAWVHRARAVIPSTAAAANFQTGGIGSSPTLASPVRREGDFRLSIHVRNSRQAITRAIGALVAATESC